jgi:hypothetical protein
MFDKNKSFRLNRYKSQLQNKKKLNNAKMQNYELLRDKSLNNIKNIFQTDVRIQLEKYKEMNNNILKNKIHWNNKLELVQVIFQPVVIQY